MREIAKKIMKSMFLRIAVCSIGGILTIFGIMFGIYSLVRLPDGVSIYVPYIVLAVFTLPIGLYLCFLVIKQMHFFVKSRKITKEAKAIENIKKYMKQGKGRIVVFSILLVFMVAASMWIMSKVNKLAEAMTPEHIRLLVLVKFMINHYLFGLYAGFVIFILINEIAGFTKNKLMLTLNMWERIQELENEIKELKAGTQEDNKNK
jgi:hypothetical protein